MQNELEAVARLPGELVAGLAAKPVIDMCLVVADSSDEEAYVPALEAAGYVLRIREPEWYEHRVFKNYADAKTEVVGRIIARAREPRGEATGQAGEDGP
jgi:GrpB-like predicted nucleotidyltransferase (UPF0157 family)